jgi:hypothetical protein
VNFEQVQACVIALYIFGTGSSECTSALQLYSIIVTDPLNNSIAATTKDGEVIVGTPSVRM